MLWRVGGVWEAGRALNRELCEVFPYDAILVHIWSHIRWICRELGALW